MLVTIGFAALSLPTAAFGAAARVEFVAGTAIAVDVQGKERVLARGTEVREGDTVDTRSARVQLRFSDGAFVSLQPQSKFRIDEYRFSGRTDGSERGFFSLLQGGLRTITGLVGRTNKKNYQVSTGIATIGIRGTEYTVSYGNSLSGSVGEGEIAVCNAGGCTNVASGESYFVPTAELKPVVTGKKTDLPPPQPQENTPKFVVGDTTTAAGTPAGLQLSGTQPLALAHAVSINCASTCSVYGVIPSDLITFADSGAVASVNSGNDPLTGVTEFGNNGLIAWGRGLDRYGQYFHYATGLPTASTELAQLAISTPVATYSVIGATSPVAGAGPSQVTGQFQGATLTARFNAGLVDASVQFSIGGSTVVASAAGMPIDAASGMTFDSTRSTGSAGCTGGGCSPGGVQMAGFLAGPGAVNAGLAYQIKYVQDSSGVLLPGPVSGSVAFQQNQ